MTFGSRMIVFFGLSISRMSGSSSSRLGSGFAGGGVYLGAAAASSAATSGETTRVRFGALGGGAFSAGLGAKTGEDAGGTGVWAGAQGTEAAAPSARITASLMWMKRGMTAMLEMCRLPVFRATLGNN